ncbi:hypothetical protein VP01_1226g2 [Puccinia sorghi]|uniref:Uncharacterized protein n=1 Tax=Puccinia sorghi TaxID=27349 RepID=A0A0L6VPW0_9BASI|nr:hypothetical protein VP01_1226g2 [Puccinia sorghi]
MTDNFPRLDLKPLDFPSASGAPCVCLSRKPLVFFFSSSKKKRYLMWILTLSSSIFAAFFCSYILFIYDWGGGPYVSCIQFSSCSRNGAKFLVRGMILIRKKNLLASLVLYLLKSSIIGFEWAMGVGSFHPAQIPRKRIFGENKNGAEKKVCKMCKLFWISCTYCLLQKVSTLRQKPQTPKPAKTCIFSLNSGLIVQFINSINSLGCLEFPLSSWGLFSWKNEFFLFSIKFSLIFNWFCLVNREILLLHLFDLLVNLVRRPLDKPSSYLDPGTLADCRALGAPSPSPAQAAAQRHCLYAASVNSENHSKDPRIRIRSPNYPRHSTFTILWDKGH